MQFRMKLTIQKKAENFYHDELTNYLLKIIARLNLKIFLFIN